MRDFSTVEHHPAIEEITDVLVKKTQNTDRKFFRVVIAYFLAKMAASMRAKVFTKDRGEIPVNIYGLALAPSGSGKGHSINIIEDQLIKPFKNRFFEETFPTISDQTLWKHAARRAVMNSTDDTDEHEKVTKEFKQLGALAFTFDSGTPAAIKQMRQKLLFGEIGAINLQIDEIGSNLLASTDILNVFLELYDQGLVKQKLTKNTNENIRSEELDGKTPTNALMFGTPIKLLDGGPTESAFFSFLETGYARRCLFAFGHRIRAAEEQTAEEIFKNLTQQDNSVIIDKWADRFYNLADCNNYNIMMQMDDAVAIELVQYKIDCEQIADALPEHEEIKKAELSHRYFKALKLAGALAFVDMAPEVEMDHLLSAMKLVEESGAAFQELLNRERTYVKLARYLADVGTEQTHADLHEALPYYKANAGARNEMMTMAMAWAYRQHIVIRKQYIDGIEFFRGESLKETDTDKMLISYSDNYAYNYLKEEVPFDKLHMLTQMENYHWANHGFKNQHRAEENVIPGFNMVVLDVDGTSTLSQAHDLLSEYKFMTYTTKRHKPDEEHRFRLIMPINYTVNLDQDDYKEFISSVLNWLPFKVDESANQRSRKWSSCHTGSYHYNDGLLLDALQFIPKTTKHEQFKSEFNKIENLDNLERWFAQRIATGNRNNNMLKFAMALVDDGFTYPEIENRVLRFNNQLSNGLSEDEIRSSILVTVSKKLNLLV